MKKLFNSLAPTLIVLGIFLSTSLNAANDTAVLVEAETATLGSSLDSVTADGVTFITANTNFTGNSPSSGNTVATFSVTFPEAGEYELYARIYVGPGAANDDSFIPAISLGNATVGTVGDWSVANGLWNSGFSDPDEFVLSTGDIETEVWKWIRVSSLSGVGVLTVPSDQLTQTYKLSTREDGLRIDKLAFGPLRVTFTVDQLDNGLPGWNQGDTGGEPFQSEGPILAFGKSKFLGSVWSTNSANNKDFEFYWNGMWHGNGGKWGSVEGTRDVMNWANLDEGYNYAKANGVKFNFHVLLWGAQQPGWINNLSQVEQLEEIHEWMAAVANRYPDIDYLQVVNEPINAPPDGIGTHADYMDALGGEGETGFDWILEAFRIAKEYFPDTSLMINEYSVEGDYQKSDQYVEIIEALQAEDLIDLIGLQGHAFSTSYPSVADMETILDKIAATGLPIMLTEMEIDGHDDFVQLEEYKRVFPIYWEHPSVIGINISGHIGNWRYDQGAYLVNDNFSERLALKWLRTYVASVGTQTFGGYLTNRNLLPETHTFNADYDNDLIVTGIEYLLGLDPETSDYSSVNQLSIESLTTSSLTVSSDVGQGILELQYSYDLESWNTTATYDFSTNAADGFSAESENGFLTLSATATLVNGSERVFYRYQFTLETL